MKYHDKYAELKTLECPVDRLFGVWQLSLEPGYFRQGTSRTGFLMHLILEGEYAQQLDGIRYEAKAGDLVIFANSESHQVRIGAEGIAFYSVWFSAPSISSFFNKITILKSTDAILDKFRLLHECSFESNPVYRNLELFSKLLDLLAEIGRTSNLPFYREQKDSFQSKIEYFMKFNGIYRPTLKQLCEVCDCSPATVIRACKKETGMTPGKYVQKIRMLEAYSLLRLGELNVTQIAEILQYPGIHEFTREFSGYFDFPPSKVNPQKKKI
jgi:AraC-like DNA-binding protein